MHHPETTVLLRTGDKINLKDINSGGIKIEGSRTGLHNFRIMVSDDNKTLILIPDIVFLHGEKVAVSINHQSGLLSDDHPEIFSFNFNISKNDLRTTSPDPVPYNTARPPYTFPALDITMSGNYYDEPLFFYIITALASNHDRFLTIIEPDGSIIYALQRDNEGLGFILQDSGYLSYFSMGKFMLMDSLYNIVDSFKCGNGYFTDWHEFQHLKNGHALLFSYDNQSVDMSQIVAGGDTNAVVEGLVIQEIDTDKNIVFQWRSWDYYEITDATHVDFLDSYFSYVHGNALELSNDSNILLSSRLMDEITKIDRNTGDIIWRCGGKNNEFTFINDTGMFSRQH
ncbi:MAG: aryl-sulfate sulfotransferase, partial [Bacteroidota bacterium]